jgi:hypothetical protein
MSEIRHPNTPDLEASPSGGTQELVPAPAQLQNMRDVAGRNNRNVEKVITKSLAFVPGQVETIDFLSTATARLDQELGFPVHSIMVDNPTTQWLFVQSAQRFVMPGLMGLVMQVPRAANKAEAQWRAPVGVTQPALENATTATITFCEAFLAPNPGTLSGQAVGMIGEVQIEGADGTSIATVGVPNADDIAAAASLFSESFMYLFNGGGTGWDRARSAQAINMTAANPLEGVNLVAQPGEWSITSTPVANTQATVTRAASGGVAHVARSLDGALIAGTVAPAATNAVLNLRDSTTGAGTVLWAEYMSCQAVAGDKDDYQSDGRNIIGTVGNAMSFEFVAAGGANTLESVSLGGYDVD